MAPALSIECFRQNVKRSKPKKLIPTLPTSLILHPSPSHANANGIRGHLGAATAEPETLPLLRAVQGSLKPDRRGRGICPHQRRLPKNLRAGR